MDRIESVVIVGASLAGMQGAHTLRTEGFDGRVTVIDADPHTPYDKPPLSKQVLKGDWDVDRLGLPAADEDLDLDLRLGSRASALDLERRVVRIVGPDTEPEDVGFDRLLIATGASARRLPDTPDLAGIHLLRSLDDCLASPWGTFHVLEDADTHKVKRITVEPGQRLSYQLHHRRAEHWVLVAGQARVTLDDVTHELSAGESIHIGRGSKHRIENPGNETLVFIEVQTGDYFGEDDIVRIEDDYGRSA